MARTDTLTNFLTDVADSIRSKTGKSDAIACEDFDTEIESISGGGDLPEKGVVFSEYDSDGYPTKVEFVGMTTMPDYCFYNNNAQLSITSKISNVKLNNVTNIGRQAFHFNQGLQEMPTNNLLTSIGVGAFGYSKITSCNIPNSVTTLKNSAFSYCSMLTTAVLSDSLLTLEDSTFSNCTSLSSINLKNITSVGANAFQNCSNLETIDFSNVTQIKSGAFNGCSKLNFTKLPDSLTNLGTTAFNYCTSLKKFSVKNLSAMNGGGTYNTSFGNCTGLKQVWIGDRITGLNRYVFYNCTALEKIYIDKPRATVEGFAGYTYAFMNDTTKTGIIVCNDDAGFITREEFDALEIE